jgi:hypothetical protein
MQCKSSCFQNDKNRGTCNTMCKKRNYVNVAALLIIKTKNLNIGLKSNGIILTAFAFLYNIRCFFFVFGPGRLVWYLMGQANWSVVAVRQASKLSGSKNMKRWVNRFADVTTSLWWLPVREHLVLQNSIWHVHLCKSMIMENHLMSVSRVCNLSL